MNEKNFRRCGEAIYFWNDKKYGNIMLLKNVIYQLKSADGKIYIGSAANMGPRLLSHLKKTNRCKYEPPYANGLGITKSVEVSIIDVINDETKRRQVEHELIVQSIQQVITAKLGYEVPDFTIQGYKELWNTSILNTLT